MGLIPLGILSSAGSGFGYELIQTTILGSNTASVVFSGLASYSSDYEHLQIRAVVRSNRATFQNTYFHLRLNGDSTASYSNHFFYSTPPTITGFAGTSGTEIAAGWVASQNATANIFGASVIDITDAYSSTKNKTVRIVNGVAGGDTPRVNFMSGAFLKTNSISSVTILSTAGDLITGSRFSIYGIR
jgi:hypothetical protein